MQPCLLVKQSSILNFQSIGREKEGKKRPLQALSLHLPRVDIATLKKILFIHTLNLLISIVHLFLHTNKYELNKKKVGVSESLFYYERQ